MVLTDYISGVIDRHNCCIDSDIVERKAFFMEVICKLYFFNEETIPNISTSVRVIIQWK